MPDQETHEKLDKILLILQGNGRPQNGLVTKHELLSDSVAKCQARHNESRKDFKWILTVIVAVAAVLVAWLK